MKTSVLRHCEDWPQSGRDVAIYVDCFDNELELSRNDKNIVIASREHSARFDGAAIYGSQIASSLRSSQRLSEVAR